MSGEAQARSDVSSALFLTTLTCPATVEEDLGGAACVLAQTVPVLHPFNPVVNAQPG